jgi:exodeoxyribonuclease VII small subunit
MTDDLSSLSFEQAVGELESTVQRLEAGDLSLTEAIALYERGMYLVQHCNDALDSAELQVQELAQSGSDPEA